MKSSDEDFYDSSVINLAFIYLVCFIGCLKEKSYYRDHKDCGILCHLFNCNKSVQVLLFLQQVFFLMVHLNS